MHNSTILSRDQIRQMFRVGPAAVHSEAEKESDLILAGDLITPKTLRLVRMLGGGPISAVISADVGKFLGLPFSYFRPAGLDGAPIGSTNRLKLVLSKCVSPDPLTVVRRWWGTATLLARVGHVVGDAFGRS